MTSRIVACFEDGEYAQDFAVQIPETQAEHEMLLPALYAAFGSHLLTDDYDVSRFAEEVGGESEIRLLDTGETLSGRWVGLFTGGWRLGFLPTNRNDVVFQVGDGTSATRPFLTDFSTRSDDTLDNG